MTAQPSPKARSARGDRYERRRRAIISAATELLNIHGVKGMRLADVAAKLGLTTTSVTYYYKRKEDLAVACFEDGFEFFEATIAEAARAGDPAERIRQLIRLFLEAQARIRRGEQAPITVFADIPALKEPQHTAMVRAYLVMQNQLADLFEAPGYEWLDAEARMARAHALLEQLLWSPTWLYRYSLDDYPRLEQRLSDILLNGLAAPGRRWSPEPLQPAGLNPAAEADPSGQEMFLGVATKLINERGYRGASVNAIAAELNLTKGSFYHHHQAKDDLVVACFRRSFSFVRSVQRQVRELEGDEWLKLSTAVAALVEHQVSPDGPLLRSTALVALPPELRVDMVRRSERVSDHFASMISDGVAEGGVRPVDPFIAAQMITAMINAASDLTRLDPPLDTGEVAALYARPLLVGMLAR